MNRFFGILGLCLCVNSVHCEEMVVIFPPGRAETARDRTEWVVPEKRFLDPTNSWDPESQKLPADLNRYYGIARASAITNYTWSSPPELALIDIRQITALVGSETTPQAPVERAIITFYFYDPGRSRSPMVMTQMLLDGTVAQLRSQRGKKRRRPT
jgi:hypothetical protein